MKIEDLVGISTAELEKIAASEELLQEHFGWALAITRPICDKNVIDNRKVATKKKVAKAKKATASGQLDAARLYAIEQAAKMGIELKL